MTDSLPLLSSLIVTSDRPRLLKRSVHSFVEQTYPNKELVVVDNGTKPIRSVLDEFHIDKMRYTHIEPSKDILLGDLRNISLEEASGDILACWDDDDWFHPKRLEKQFQLLKQGYRACCLHGNLFHVATDEFLYKPYRGSLPDGSPSTIMHYKNNNIRYPSLPREEDTVYLKKWRRANYTVLPLDYAYLFVRCFHGSNVSGKKHFLRRLRNSPANWLQYVWYKKMTNNLFNHPKFKLTRMEKQSFDQFIAVSKKYELVSSKV